MVLKFVWADGHLGLAAGASSIHHKNILEGMLNEGQIQGMPSNYVGGMFTADDFHGPAFDKVRILHEKGQYPTPDELKFMIQQELNRTNREATYERLAAGSEDTEPKGENVGFLREPHDELYPNLFRGEDKIPEDVKAILKNHVLEPLSSEFSNPDAFIYFTIYGSGISYNWDEGGDLDLQLWIDIEKYSATADDPLTIDDLLADVRRIVQTVNFPTFAELGLKAPDDSKEDTAGSMMIQYYPKPGKGTKDENLASQPYACYDLETDEWLVEPKPMRPEFYGDEFLMLMPKAKDVALQAEALLGEFQRNILNWSFWFSLYNRHQNEQYKKEYREAMQDATQEREGIKNLFEGVFGGRAQAYSPEGKGILDERDIIQKLLEVWGTFQDLKHFARSPLPWEEQEMPAMVSATLRLASVSNDILFAGGGTFDAQNLLPVKHDHGFYVSVIGHEQTMPASSFNDAAIRSYLDYTDFHPGEYLGAWVDSDQVYLDKTKWIPDREDAINFGLKNHQRAIWDIKNTAEVYLSGEHTSHVIMGMIKTAGWSDIMEKAQRLRDNGQVQISLNVSNHVIGIVQGDHGTYNTEIWRDDPNSGTITLWNCDCPWSEYSWGRTRKWKKYEGRPCAHTLALYWTALATPVQDENQQTIPGTSPAPAPPPPQPPSLPEQQQSPLNIPDALQQTVPPKMPQSQPVTPQQGEQLTISFPGALSKWRKEGQFMNGDYVRTNTKVDGNDDRGTYYVVPRNMIGEVLWSDDDETIAIFSIESGPLGAHLVRVTAPTDSFSLVPRTKGTMPRRHR